MSDDLGRLKIAEAGISRDDRFAVSAHTDGQILLTPMVSIPKRELVVWENEELGAAVERGLAQSAAGHIGDGGDFTQYLDADDQSG